MPRKTLIGIEVNQIKFESEIQPCQLLDTPLQRDFKLFIFNRLAEFLKRTGRSNNFFCKYFNETFQPIQVRGKHIPIPIYLLSKMKLCKDQLISKGQIEKLSRCSEGSSVSPIVITAKMDGSIQLTLNSKLLYKQIFRNRYQKPN